MSDYRDPSRSPNDPLWQGRAYEPTSGENVGWGWIAGALALVVIVTIAFGVGHNPTQTASNDTPATASRLVPPPANPPRQLNPAFPGLTPSPPPQTQPQ
jgi:hypothetical protein